MAAVQLANRPLTLLLFQETASYAMILTVAPVATRTLDLVLHVIQDTH